MRCQLKMSLVLVIDNFNLYLHFSLFSYSLLLHQHLLAIDDVHALLELAHLLASEVEDL